MKKCLLSCLLCAATLLMSAGEMTFTTSKEVGSKVRILLNASSATHPVSIDWGNGVEMKYTVDPSQYAYNRWIEGTVEGETLIIKGNVTEACLNELNLTSAVIENMSYLTELDLAQNQITSFEIKGIAPLTTLNLNENCILNSPSDGASLTLENVGETLTNLSIAYNPGLTCLDVSSLEVLEYLTLNDCPDFGSIFICLPEDSRPSLRSINLNNCDLAHFYPVNLPNLRTLNLANNALMTVADDDPFVMGEYPELQTFDISGNPAVDNVDLSQCTKLENLNISGDRFTAIDVSQAPELTVLNAKGNQIASFDLGNNLNLRTINVAGNPVRELDLSAFRYLRSIDISDTQIARVLVMNASYLEEFRAANTNLEFVDFNGQQAQRMRIVDLRDNKKMTGATVTYTLRTLPEAKSTTYGSGDANLLLAGSNAETADTGYATSSDMQWKSDVTGDGTATNHAVSVTLMDAEDTGENRTGHLDRLYPIFAMGLDYDFDIYSTSGGKFLISQWQPAYYQTMNSVVDEALVGVPIHIYPYPEEGKKFRSVTVNGEEIYSQWFVVDKDAQIRVNFSNAENSIAFETNKGQNLSMLINTVNNNGTVWVDWGTGTRTEYRGQNKYTSGYSELAGTRIDGTAAGNTVTLYGDIAGVDLSGFGDVAEYFGLWDNAVSSIDLSNSESLKYLNLYWNPIKTIDLASCPDLEVLNVSYTALKSLDVSKNPNIMWLDAYSDGYGDEEEGIAQLTSIDVSSLAYLQYLNVKGNLLTSLDVSNNEWLTWLNANNNELTSIDVTSNPYLEELEVQGNKLTSLDISKNPELTTLSIDHNDLKSLDVSANNKLQVMIASNNELHALDTSMLPDLRRLYINGNGMSADELNDLYYLLPQRKDVEEENQPSWNLAVIQGTDRSENDGNRADSSIAVDRGWTPSHMGSNGGPEVAYLDILPTYHGSVTVADKEGNVYGHGSKVPKYTELIINAIPDEGYRMSNYTLNDDEPVADNTFTMPGIYTKLRVAFVVDNGVDDINADDCVVTAVAGGVYIKSNNANVDIFTSDGRVAVSAQHVYEDGLFPLTPGLYLVRVSGDKGIKAVKVMVK